MDRDQPHRNMAKELKDSFHRKGLHHLAKYHLKGAHKLEALKTINHYEHARKQEMKDYHETYEERLTNAVKKLQEKAGQKRLEHNHPYAHLDRFDKTQLLTQAHRQLRNAHQLTLSLLDKQETRALETIALKAGHRDTSAEALTKLFERAGKERSHQKERDPDPPAPTQTPLRTRFRSR